MKTEWPKGFDYNCNKKKLFKTKQKRTGRTEIVFQADYPRADFATFVQLFTFGFNLRKYETFSSLLRARDNSPFH